MCLESWCLPVAAATIRQARFSGRRGFHRRSGFACGNQLPEHHLSQRLYQLWQHPRELDREIWARDPAAKHVFALGREQDPTRVPPPGRESRFLAGWLVGRRLIAIRSKVATGPASVRNGAVRTLEFPS